MLAILFLIFKFVCIVGLIKWVWNNFTALVCVTIIASVWVGLPLVITLIWM